MADLCEYISPTELIRIVSEAVHTSHSQARRLINAGAVTWNGEPLSLVEGWSWDGSVLRIGAKTFVHVPRIVTGWQFETWTEPHERADCDERIPCELHQEKERK